MHHSKTKRKSQNFEEKCLLKKTPFITLKSNNLQFGGNLKKKKHKKTLALKGVYLLDIANT